MQRLLLVAALASCAQSGATVCPFDESLVCPPDTVCVQLTLPDENACVSPTAIAACDGIEGRGGCPLGVDEDGDGEPDRGRCYDGVCLPIACGNGRLDFEEDEVCDDRNSTAGDGCSASCLSNETCGNGRVDPIVANRPSEQCDDTNSNSYDGCSSTCAPERATWTPIAYVPAPEARQGHIGVYNARQQRLVVFGGSNDGQFAPTVYGDTLEFDGRGWQNVTPLFGPSRRSYAAAAYDAARDRVVMFGGVTSMANVDETWEWDGARWVPRMTNVAPAARARAVMAYDSRRKVSVLFGGSAGATPLDDTWEWDGIEWTTHAKDARPARLEEAAMAYDPARGVMVLVGYNEQQRQMLHYEYDGTAWTERMPSTRPAPVRGAAMAFDAVRQQVVVISGGDTMNDHRVPDAWAFTGTGWESIGLAGAPARRDAIAVSVADRSPPTLWMFGGGGPFILSDVTYLNDLRVWDSATSTWSEIVSSPPQIAEPPAAVLDTARHTIVFHGRMTAELDGTWGDFVSTAAVPVFQHAMVYDSARARTVLFGGRRQNRALTADTWEWDGEAWTQRAPTTSPEPRGFHALAYDAKRAEVVLFGGDDTVTTFGDTLVWDGTTWTRREPAVAPAPRRGAAMAYDPVRERVILFGGEDRSNSDRIVYGDTWEWDGSTWTRRDTSVAPYARGFASLAWNPARRKLMLVGGLGSENENYGDTWEWDGTSWAPLDVGVLPTARYGGALVSSPSLDAMHLLGGWTDVQNEKSSPAHDVLRWRGDTVDRETCTGALDGDTDGLVGCADPGCWHRCDPTCFPGTACDATRPHCGDGACDAVLETARSCPADCGTAAAVCGDFVCDANEACLGDCVSPP